MGWNDARISLIAPNFKVMTHADAVIDEQGLVRSPAIISYERIDEEFGASITLSDLSEWLLECGFDNEMEDEGTACFKRGDIRISCVFDDPDDIGDVELEFTIGRDSIKRTAEWKGLFDALAARWSFRIYDHRRGVIAPEAFFLVLKETPAWIDFSKTYQWPDICAS